MTKTTIDTTNTTNATNATNATTIKVGLCEGRHPLPVEGYIFPQEVASPLDFNSHKKVVEQWIVNNLNLKVVTKTITTIDGLDAVIYTYDANKRVNLYVTGLTPCLTSAMQVFKQYNVPLTLWHFDRGTGTYVPQTIL